MAAIPGSVRVGGFIAPSDTGDTYATHDSRYGRGGLKEVADTTERDAISTDRRREGMIVYCASDEKTYQLKGGVTNLDWVEFVGGGSGDVTGPNISVADNVTLFSDNTGKEIKDSGVALSSLQPKAVATVGSPTHVTTVADVLYHTWSAGAVGGFVLTDNGNGTVSIGDGEAVLRTAPQEDALLISIEVQGVSNLTLVDGSINYIYVRYHGGSPDVQNSTSEADFNCMDSCILYTAVRDGNKISYVNAMRQNVDANRKHRRMLLECEDLRRMKGGSVLSGHTGTRNIAVSAGGFYYGLVRLTHNAFDTSGADTFTSVYSNGAGGWTYVPGQTEVDNVGYDDGSGTLASLTGLRYGVHWVYLVMNSPSEIVVQYGTSNYLNLSSAQEATVPAAPPLVNGLGVLLGRLIVRHNATEFASVDSAFDTAFSFARLTDHEELSGLQGGVPGEHYHLTSAEVASLASMVTTTGSETLSNKTLQGPVISQGYTEQVYTITDGAAFEIDPANGSIQIIVLGANRTPKATNFAAGQSVVLHVDDGSAYSLTWTDATFGGSGVAWKTNGGVAPTLNTAGDTVIILWKVGTQVFGARVGDA